VSVRYVRVLAAPLCVTIVSGACGWIVSRTAGADFVSGLLGGACTTVLFVGLMLVLGRALLFETFAVVLAAVRDGARRRSASVETVPSLAA
jgi:hypothetical protein